MATDPDTLVIRGSKTDLVWRCAESQIGTGSAYRVDPSMAMAEMGSAFHAWARYLGNDQQPDPEDMAAAFDVDPSELEMLCAFGKRFWDQTLRKWLAAGEAEIEMNHTVPFEVGPYKRLMLRARADNVAAVPASKTAYVHDWKTGRLEGDHEHQLRTVGFLTLKRYPEIDRVWTGISYVRLGFIDARFHTRDALEQWFDELLWKARNGIGTYRPGSHCTRCARQHNCEARDDYTRSTLTVFGQDLSLSELLTQPPSLAGPTLADMLRQAKMVSGVCDRLKTIAREYAEEHGGRFPAGDGRVYEARKVTKRAIRPLEGWPVISEALGHDEEAVARCVTIRKTAMNNEVKAKAPRGKKGAAVAALADALKEAGAIEETESTRLEETKGEYEGP